MKNAVKVQEFQHQAAGKISFDQAVDYLSPKELTRVIQTVELRKAIVDLKNKNLNQYEIAKKLGISQPSIHLNIKAMEEARSQSRKNRPAKLKTPKGRFTAAGRQYVKHLFDQGSSYTEIAREFEVSTSAIWYIINRNSVAGNGKIVKRGSKPANNNTKRSYRKAAA